MQSNHMQAGLPVNSVRFLRPVLRSVAMIAVLAGSVPVVSAAGTSVVVELKEVGIGFPAEATVEAVRQATVSAQIAGRVLDLRVDAGQRVKQGELMLRLDAREAAGGDAAARANLAQAKAAYERTRNLLQSRRKPKPERGIPELK